MDKYLNESFSDLSKVAAENKSVYLQGQPFPSIYFENAFNEEMLNTVLNEFPDLSQIDAIRFDDSRQKKYAGKGESGLGPETKSFIHYLNSQPFLEFIQKLTGIEETLLGDPYLAGGGLHEIKRGGLLKIHADFNKHATLGLDRRVNILVYLNKGWKEEYGGHLELWDADVKECAKRIPPKFNTLAIFTTTSTSFHGHPNPLNFPENLTRKSLALYYYSNGRPSLDASSKQHGTLFRERTDNNEDQVAFKVGEKNKVKVLLKRILPVTAKNIAKKMLDKSS